MQINWYPGHMTKAGRIIDENIGLVDAVIYVLDARAPISCMIPEFDKRIAEKPVLYALTKADLADEKITSEFLKEIKRERPSSAALAIDATGSRATAQIPGLLKNLCFEKLEKSRRRGIRPVLRAMVVGVPNCGKSTVINNLCGAARTVTGDKAGVTRGKQWVRVNDYFELCDTPGTLQPKLTDQAAAKRLAYMASVKDEVVDTLWLAGELIADINSAYPEALKERYGVSVSCENGLEEVASARGLLLKGGIKDTERAASVIIDDFRKGRLGRITLDRPGEKL